MTVNAQYAAEHLSELFDAADRGEEVEISRTDKATLKLVPSRPVARDLSKEQIEANRNAMIGAGKGKIWLADDWNSLEVNATIAKDFEESELFPGSLDA